VSATPTRPQSWGEEYRAMAKPRAVEGVGDLYLIRPLGYLLVQVLRRTPITPTMVSFLAIAAAWWSAWLYYGVSRDGGNHALALLAAAGFLLHSALDSADGQLARVTNRTSEVGRIVDGFCDSLSFIGIYVGILLGYAERVPEHRVTVALLALAATYTHSLQSSLTEYQRTLYLLCVHGKRDIVESEPARLERAAAGGGLFARLMHVLHLPYYRQQRRLLPSTARLERFVVRLLKERPQEAPRLAAVYERHQRPTLGGWTLLASNVHKGGIVLAAFLPVGEGFWGGLGMAWYFLFDLGLNGAMAWLIRRQGRIDRRTLEELSSTSPAAAV